jgi:hypothetical protein
MDKGYDTTFTRARRLTENTHKKLTNLMENLCCARENSVQFFVQFFCTVKLHSLTVSVWAPHLLLCNSCSFLSVMEAELKEKYCDVTRQVIDIF